MLAHHRLPAVFCLLLLVLLTACGPAQPPPAAQPAALPAPTELVAAPTSPPTTSATGSASASGLLPENVLAYVRRSDFSNLDPSRGATAEPQVLANVYETLTYVNLPGSAEILAPRLATSWQANAEGTEWTFHLQQGVKFHDGTDVNAAAVKYSIERTIALQEGASYILDPIQEVVVVDDDTVTFKLKYAAALDIILGAPYAAYIMSPTATEAHDEEWLQGHDAGSGPYTIDSWEHGTRVILKAYPSYRGGWRPGQFSRVAIEIVDDAMVRQQMLESGEADVTYRLQRESLPALRANPDITVYSSPGFENLMAWLNVTKPPLDNKLVRQALSYAMPYEQIVDGVLQGGGTLSRGPVPVGVWGHSEDLFQYSHDLEKARALLAEAGHPQGGFSLIATFSAGDDDQQQILELWKAELAKLGVTLQLQGMTWDARWQLAKSDPAAAQDVFLMFWYQDWVTPWSYLYPTFHCEDEPFYNVAYYCNPEFDRLIDSANSLSATDRPGATERFIEAQAMLIEDAPALFLFDNAGIRILRSDIKGYVDNPAYPHVVFFYELSR